VRSDHQNLTGFTTAKDLNARQARWAEDLSAYNFRIEHVAGKNVADALSRKLKIMDSNDFRG
jgi:hypothetical protein